MMPVEPSTPPVEPVKSPGNWGMSFLMLFLGILLGAGGLWGYQYWSAKQVAPTPSPVATPTPEEAILPTPNITAINGIFTDKTDKFLFKYPTSLSVVTEDIAGVSPPFTGNPQFIVTLTDNSSMPGTDAAFNGFSIYLMSDLNGLSFKDYLNQEVQTEKDSPRGISDTKITYMTVNGLQVAFINPESSVRRYFIDLPNNKVISINVIYTTSKFLNTIDQILSTFKFTQ